MASVTISSKYQIVIPLEVRSRLKLKPGQKVSMIEKDGVVHLIPLKPIRTLRGIAKGVTTKNLRDESERI